jgi:hypothetical protein
MSVTANGTGTLSYQWYGNASASTTGGTAVGTSSGSYTPDASVIGTTYYYCVVTGDCGSATSAISGAMIVNPIPKQLSLKVILQGFYNITNSNMNKCKDYVNSAAVDNYTGSITDLITVELHNATTYATIEYTTTAVELHQDGTCNSAGSGYIEIPAEYTGNYYITIKTRNHLKTTTSSAVSFSNPTISYDFSDAATKAYGSNMKLLNTGVYGVYAGDVNQDGNMTPRDLSTLLTALKQGVEGYNLNDLDGNGNISPTDLSTLLTALKAGVSKSNP